MMDKNFIQIHRAMDRAVAESVFPGAVLAWGIGPNLLFHRAYGRTDETCGETVSPHTIFDLASLTKPLATALALAVLVQKGQISLYTSLGEILPEARGMDKSEITLDMLLRHTSGLPAHREYFKRMPSSEPRSALRQMILAESLETAPGKKEIYSDLGYMLLAWVVEAISGRRLDHFVRDFIYAPLGLSGLFFVPAEAPRPDRDSVAATSHCPWRGRLIKGEVEDENAWAAGGVEGHAGLFGDGVSVYRICNEILAAVTGEETKVLDSKVIRSFVRQIPGMKRMAGFDTPSKENSSAGCFFSNRALGHLGFTGTSFWLDPETGLIVVLLTNRVHPTRENWKIRKFRPLIHDLIHHWVSSESNVNKPV